MGKIRKSGAEWSPEEKFAAVLETAFLNAEELAEYCVNRGVMAAQIELWRNMCRSAPSIVDAQERRIRQLERQLARKEQALNDAAELLVLRRHLQTSCTALVPE